MNILIVKMSAIGDVVHTLPALSAIRKRYPDAHIAWLVEEDASALVKGHAALDRVLVSRRKRWIDGIMGPSCLPNIKEIYGFIGELRDTWYDLIIDFQGLFKSGLLVGLCRGERKVGFGKGMEHQEFSYLFLTERIPPVNMDTHALTRNMMLLDAVGIASDEIEYDLPVRDSHREGIKALLLRHGVRDVQALVAINPVASWETKLWSEAKFASLADQLISRFGSRVIFTGSEADHETIENIISAMSGEAVNLAGETSLMTLAALYEKVDFLVSTDSGPMHIAAAVGTPVVGLFGPTAPWRTGPFGSGHQIIRVGLECSPCFQRRCESPDCMGQIGVEQVLSGVRQLGVV